MPTRKRTQDFVANNPGFTVVELLIAAIVLGLFASLLLPTVAGSQGDSKAAAASAAVRAAQSAIDRHHAVHGSYPSDLDAAWFRAYKLPQSPYLPTQPNGAVANVQDLPGKIYPGWKSEVRHSDPFWYNRANGIVRIRVLYQGTDEASLALFNRVNGTNAKYWNQEYRD